MVSEVIYYQKQTKAAAPGIRTFKLSQLKAAEYNPRTIDDAAMAGLTKSIERFGCVEPIVVNVRGGANRIVGGHQRLKALAALGVKQCICVTVNCNEADEKLLNLSLNNPLIQGQFIEQIGEYIAALQKEIPRDSAFLDMRIAELADEIQASGKEGLTPDDQIPEPPKKPKTKTGDLYILGQHKLFCGDSTSKESVAACLQKERPLLMVTDPPYGVQYDPAWRHKIGVNNSTRTGAVANDNRASWSEAFNLFHPDVAYIWHSGLHAMEVERSLSACGLELRAQIIWVKQRFVLSRGHYHWRHEPCFYAVRGNGGGQWRGNRKHSTVWADIIDHFAEMPDMLVCEIDAETLYAFEAGRTTVWRIAYDKGTETIHSTQKPVECMARPMRHNSSEGDAVCDPFLGTGSSIIAAEKFNRRCFGMEIDPIYCDVIVRRWEEYTGKKAELIRGK
jgi:DNA modification methylase